jgi:hypothetical protein
MSALPAPAHGMTAPDGTTEQGDGVPRAAARLSTSLTHDPPPAVVATDAWRRPASPGTCAGDASASPRGVGSAVDLFRAARSDAAEPHGGRAVVPMSVLTGYSPYSVAHFATPLVAAVWSCSPADASRLRSRTAEKRIGIERAGRAATPSSDAQPPRSRRSGAGWRGTTWTGGPERSGPARPGRTVSRPGRTPGGLGGVV